MQGVTNISKNYCCTTKFMAVGINVRGWISDDHMNLNKHQTPVKG